MLVPSPGHRPVATAAATAAATAPVPQDRVSPEPRSWTRISTSFSPASASTSTLAPAGKIEASTSGGTVRSKPASGWSTTQARCGLPTLTAIPEHRRPPISAELVPSALAGPMSTLKVSRSACQTSRIPARVAIAIWGPAASPESIRYLANTRIPLPHISAMLPSALR